MAYLLTRLGLICSDVETLINEYLIERDVKYWKRQFDIFALSDIKSRPNSIYHCDYCKKMCLYWSLTYNMSDEYQHYVFGRKWSQMRNSGDYIFTFLTYKCNDEQQ